LQNKETSRDYITAAMQLYAAEGRPCAQNIKSRGYPVSMRRDIECVEKTLTLLSNRGEANIIRAIERVYFIPPYSPLKKSDIANRVRLAAQDFPADERTIYRWLKCARVMAARYRGLRC